MQAGAAAEPDGHTLILGSDSSLVRNPMLRPGIPYDPERDFAPIARLVISWYAIAVHASVPARTRGGIRRLGARQSGAGELRLGRARARSRMSSGR